MGWEYAATADGRLSTHFRCTSCGFASPCTIRVAAGGYAKTEGFTPTEAGRRRAMGQALEGQKRLADVMMSIATCPRCQKQDAAGVAALENRQKKVLLAFASFDVAAVAAVVLAVQRGSTVMAAVAGLIAVGTTIGVPLSLMTLGSMKKRALTSIEWPAQPAVR
ncbi:MAG: hypothetical protein K1X89_01485 [Myxococcaceae bacterium]|nr:hypothetical protein [Myxococcaceae bacterium]